MNNIEVPLISPLSRKYYDYASNKNEYKHHRAEDVRICLEYIWDHMIYIFVSDADKEKWQNYKLHKKIMVSKNFLDGKIVNKLNNAKLIGNSGVHDGEEWSYTEKDIEDSLESIKEFSLEIFYAYFKEKGFVNADKMWVPTVFSVLPPMYRIKILEKYYNNCEKTVFVIDKLSMAYVKAGLFDKAKVFLRNCYKDGEIDYQLYNGLNEKVILLNENRSLLPIADELETSKESFNTLLSSIDEDERDTFICLMSIILNG